jgi:predicted MFS family arabinose efflux permease
VAPLVFLGGFGAALLGTLLWGVALGVQGSVLSAAVARMIPAHARARAFGLFTATFGIAWFLGSAALGALYDVSLAGLVAVSVIPQLMALVPLSFALREMERV